MNKEDDKAFLFDISNEIKQFYGTPVIFLTKKDFSDIIFNALCTIRSALQNESKNQVIDIIVDLHLEWLHTINGIELFEKRIETISKEELIQAIRYTIDAMANRFKYYKKYMDKYRPIFSNNDQDNILTELEIVDDMHKEMNQALLEKLSCFREFTGNEQFKIKVILSIEELRQWIDNITDNVVILLSKYINFHGQNLREELSKVLQKNVEELQMSRAPFAQKMLDDVKMKGKDLNTMLRFTTDHNLEVKKVVEKINNLDESILKLVGDPSSATIMALTRKKEYLEGRLLSLDKLKTTLKILHESSGVKLEVSDEELCICEDYFRFRIFNHSLPAEERVKLVTELCYLWDSAIFGEHSKKSLISILSAVDIKEQFSDELGTFYIDEHSRKIYKICEDDKLYQLNELNVLVPLSDDTEHIYFFDECGRYYVDARTRERVYKAYATASEYMMDSSGNLVKTKEERDGVIYYYNNYGRYYVNERGKHIYREADTISEFESDGLGNLVRIRSHMDIFEPCPDDAHVTEDFTYLKLTIGSALRKCIADTILQQPLDPIKYLSNRLIKFRENIEKRDRQAKDHEELNIEREMFLAEQRALLEKHAQEATLLGEQSEASFDSNLLKYQSMHSPDAVSLGDSSK